MSRDEKPPEPQNPRTLWKSQLSPSRRWLVDAMHEAGFAFVKKLDVVNRDPVVAPSKIKRRRKLSGPGYKPSPLPTGDYMLKEQVVNLFDVLDKMVNGVITIEVRDGLPSELID